MNWRRGVAVLSACAAITLYAEEMKWGEPAGGLRVGIECATPKVTVDRQPKFTVKLENVGDTELTIPAPSSYVPKTHEVVTGHFVRPLRPAIETVNGQKETYSISGGDELASVSKERVVLKAHESLTLADVPLTSYSFTNGRTDYGSKTSAKRNALRKDSTYRIRFEFENENAELAGVKVWSGTAISGAAELNVEAAPVPEGIEAAYTLDSAEVGLHRPIYATFRVTNKGSARVTIPTGGDGRAGRHTRNSFTAVDENGQAVTDPMPPNGVGGGLGSSHRIEPGATYSERVLVNQWCAFSKPGKYVVTCKRTVQFESPASGHWEALMPALPVETKLTLVVGNADGLAAYLEQLPGRFLRDTNNKAREELKALTHAKVAEALPVIAGMLKNPEMNQHKRREVVHWLGLYDKEAAAGAVRGAMADSDVYVRSDALRQLAQWNDREAPAFVLKALNATDVELRRAAVMLCYQHKLDGCFAKLMTMAGDEDKIVRQYLSHALAKYEDKSALPVLLKLLNDFDADPNISLWASSGLEKLGRKDGIPVMIALMKDERTLKYRGNIQAVLERLTGQKLRQDYAEWNAWWEKERGKFEKE